jgi:excinuclease ABC subunit C
MAVKNAEAHFNKHVSKTEEKRKGLLEIQEKFSLPQFPQRIECYDISTFQGKESVASQVVFGDGVSSREDYRRYRIKTVVGTDDFASMYEVLKRRFSNKELSFPQLLLIDGGKGQLSQAVRVLQELGITNVPVASIAKARTDADFTSEEVKRSEERFFLPGQQNYIKFKGNSEALRILVSIRDEAHRFAISYHRKLRESTSFASELDAILGLGEKRKRMLLEKFVSVEQIRGLTAEEISQQCGFDLGLAERILLQLNS